MGKEILRGFDSSRLLCFHIKLLYLQYLQVSGGSTPLEGDGKVIQVTVGHSRNREKSKLGNIITWPCSLWKKNSAISHLQLHLNISHTEDALKCGKSVNHHPIFSIRETDVCTLLHWKKGKAFMKKQLPILSFKIFSFKINLWILAT